MNLPKARRCVASATPMVSDGRIEWKKHEKETTHNHVKDIGIRKVQVPLPRKTDTESYYTKAKRISNLHDLPSLHHRPNGECIQVLVGDISLVKGGDGRLG